MFRWLQDWCAAYYKAKNIFPDIDIETLDNPGWSIKFNLLNTEFEDFILDWKLVETSDENWYGTQIRDKAWDGAGGAENLCDIITKLKEFVELKSLNNSNLDFDASLAIWIQNWYLNECNGDWEHGYGAHIFSLREKMGWDVSFNLAETDYGTVTMSVDKADAGENDWFECWITDSVWHAKCSNSNLNLVLSKFKILIETSKNV